MNLSDIRPAPGSRKPGKRKGRGPGSGNGKTAGRGNKGQRSRSGYSMRRSFEGGQMPLVRRVPKRGFHNPGRKEYVPVNVAQLSVVAAHTEVTPELLVRAGIVRGRRDGVKILGGGEIAVPLVVRAHRFSEEAARKIAAAGGRTEVLAPAAAQDGGR